jgi:2-hydroxy-3-keto-5-methylthiopentenyl-1-phosphate phosphatase
MLRFAVAAARIRPGLRDLVNFACEHEIPVEVVSNGWDFYIREILRRNGFADLKFCSPHAVFQSGEFAKLSFGEAIEVCATTGLCKCERVRLRADDDRTVVYVGDGISDFCVAPEAGIVMARRELAAYCDEQGISYIPYQDMFDVLAVLKQVLNGETVASLRRPQTRHGARGRVQTTAGPS